MKMKKIFAAMAATAVSAASFAVMSVSTASAADELGKAYLVGSFGTESNWHEGENAGVSVATIDGDAQYECSWNLSEATSTGNNWFLTVVIEPVEGVDNFATVTFPDLSATLDEVWVDGVQITDFDASNAIDTNYFETSTGVTRIYIRGDWAGNSTKIIEDRDIESNIMVRFTIDGLGVEGTSNVTKEDPTNPTDPTDPATDPTTDGGTTTTTTAKGGDTTTTTTTAKGGTTTTTAKGGSTTTTTKPASNGGKTETSAATGDAGVGVAAAALVLAGTAAIAARKRK